MPVVENLRRNIRSARQEKNLPPLPMNIAPILILPVKFQTATNGDQFCYLKAVLVLLLIESLDLHQFKQDSCLFNWKIGAEMVL